MRFKIIQSRASYTTLLFHLSVYTILSYIKSASSFEQFLALAPCKSITLIIFKKNNKIYIRQ